MPNDSIADRLSGKLYRIFIALLFAYVIISAFAPMMNHVDLGWQVAQGRWIAQHFAPYSHDVFNYPNLGHPVINEYPLFEIALYFAWSLGWWGPCLLTALGYATLIGIIFCGARQLKIEASALVAISAGLMLLFFQIAFPLRPHLITFLGVSALGVFLLRHRDAESWKQFWPMALLQIAWTNSHSGFVLGPAMVGLFGAEIILRRALREKSLPWTTAQTWLGAFALVFAACFVNPYGWARFYPPLFQDSLESIRAYVGEMQPLAGGMATIYSYLTFFSIIIVVLAMACRGGAIAFSFLLLAVFFYVQAHSVMKAWPIVGLFVPLLVLSTGAFASHSRRSSSLGMLALFAATACVLMAVLSRLYPAWNSSLQHQWREYDAGRNELPIDATAWMRAHNINGRLFHRSEDGGWLQMSGYDHGETFSDTGFGKFDEAFIHETGLVGERPALVPKYLAAYQPDFVVCGDFCFQWPFYLSHHGWRLIFYSPNSSVYAQEGTRPDLPTVTTGEIEKAFDRDLSEHGLPTDMRLFGRNIIALDGHGLESFALAKLNNLPAEFHGTTWYWEAARIICFDDPRTSTPIREAFEKEAESRHDDVTAEFRAYSAYDHDGTHEQALGILKQIPHDSSGYVAYTNAEAELLLEIEMQNKNFKDALALARHESYFDLRNGRHWQYLAQAEEQAGNIDAARTAWKKAVFYYPDDADLMKAASEFAAKYHDTALDSAINESAKVYGK